VKQPGDEYRTSIRVVDESRGHSTLARATYYPRKTSNCGTQVGVGAISSAGEVVWRSIGFTGRVTRCDRFPEYARWSAHAANPGTPPRTVLAHRQIDAREVGYRFGLPGNVSIDGYDGRRLLVFDDLRGTVLHDTATGAQASYSSSLDERWDQYGERLAPGGVLTAMSEDQLSEDSGPVGLLFTNSMDPRSALTLTLPGYETQALEPCGSRLVQLGVKDRGAILVVRDLAGGTITSRALTLPAKVGGYGLDCNSSLALFRYGVFDDEFSGVFVASRSRVLEIG
jgi:hypothetical protein